MSDMSDYADRMREGDREREQRWRDEASSRDEAEAVARGMLDSWHAGRREHDELEETREARRELRERHDGMPLSGLIDLWSATEQALQRDPAVAAAQLAKFYAHRLPVPASTPTPVVSADPDDLHAEVARSYRDVRQDTEDREAMRALAERLRVSGSPLTTAEVLRRGLELDGRLREAPARVAAALAASHGWLGMPDEIEAEARTLTAEEAWRAEERRAQVAELRAGIGRVIASRRLPGLERPEVQAAVADELERMNRDGKRSGDRGVDLTSAYNAAMKRLQAKPSRSTAQDTRDDVYSDVRTAWRAAPKQRQEAAQPSSGDTIRDDILAAMRSLGSA